MRKVSILLTLLACTAAAGCSTQQQQTIITIGCAVSSATPGLFVAADDIATITAPDVVGTIQTLQSKDQLVHEKVQAACASKLAGSAPVAGTVTAVSVPSATPSSVINVVTVPVSK